MMRRRQWLRWTLGGTALAMGALPGGCARVEVGPVWRERVLQGFGTTLRLQAAHESDQRVDAALDDAVLQLRRIESQMNLFDPDSMLSRLNRSGRIDRPPEELREVLTLARDVSAASGGLFDVTVQPLWLCWEAARRAGREPSRAELAAARSRVGWTGLRIDRHAITLAPGAAVTLNGIAQGYATDRVRAVLARHGVRQALVDTGEWSALGHAPSRRAWTLGIADPHDERRMLARLALDERCVATSADGGHRFTDDRRHHHILDPHTGDSPPALSSVTVAANDGALADALTKVMFVAGPGRIPALARAWDVDVLWVDKHGRWAATPGWEGRLVAA